ncbi:hypothetical protein [Mammaliicoccus sp. E-M21]|uniref:hypothetical protein n=1 Tax=Mammaliicoccus sp. E-M21 TaxID=2898681 RepID=UPI001EFAE241|nr:hypothetical protein [Mammaliicoccus sp. E-M21]
MAFKIDVLKLNESNLGNKFVLKDITDVYRYDRENNKRTDEKLGLKYHVFSPKLKNEVLSVQVDQMDPIVDVKTIQENEEIVFVQFDNINGKMFQDFKTGEIFLSASADNVETL